MGLTGTALAIDAGNSKTDVALVGADGSVLGTARGGGFQPQTVGAGRAVDVLAPLVASALAQAGTEGPVDHVTAYLANADLPVEEAALAAEIGDRGWARSVTVGNDTFALLRAGLPDTGEPPVGVAVVCGAGINAVGLGRAGASARFPSVGRLSGDWGGGGFLADEALWYAARAEDGRGEPSELARALPAHFGLATMLELIEGLHLRGIPDRRHELAPLLFDVAAAGDPVARAIIARQADEVVLLASVALERLDLLGEETRVVLGGGVLAARHPLLHDRIVRLLAERAPKAVAHVVTAPPVLGAALHALDRAEAPADAYARLRGSWA
ncbi:N-acetylglucosamine kinase [Streptomyces pinistramenti]|uniref:N-acetylglucosamine kinase n=1 Tax=Streptomyces pinistramenti TaxID=2884812 RepID=UPI001D08F46D|nr:BadF/BadG/BcrA/BcrD ATPase family protein [Streptomyces pinistramenti]MCB5906682.1 ATPase [Streptomyces pinistramenti]